jgi:hypothetical protein
MAGSLPAIAALVLGWGTAGVREALLTAGVLAGAAIGVQARRDRCSGCGAILPLRVLDESCSVCGRAIPGIDDGGDLARRVRKGVIKERGEKSSPYRAGAAARAERDAAEEQESLAFRTDAYGHELRLRADPRVAAAIQGRDELGLYRLLRDRRRKARSIAEEFAIDTILADPRRSLEPGVRPWLGVRAGTGLLLRDARHPLADDGSFVADQTLVIGTYTVAPLAAYLVCRAERGGVEVLGRVPLPFGKRLWRAAAAMPAVAALAFGGWTYAKGRSSAVHFVNGLDVPVTVEAGRLSILLAPGAREVRVLSRGKHPLVTRDARGEVIEGQELDVPGGDPVVVYDVLGAAAIEAHEVYYAREGDPVPKDLRHELHATQRSIVVEDVAYAFVNSPHEIPGRGTLRAFQVTQIPGGWHAAVDALFAAGRKAEAVKLATDVSLAEPDDIVAVTTAVELIASGDGIAAARAHLVKVAERSPISPAVRAAEDTLRRQPTSGPLR